MEDPVLEMQSEINLAIQMVARWIANGGNGHHGSHVQKHVVEELRPLGGG